MEIPLVTQNRIIENQRKQNEAHLQPDTLFRRYKDLKLDYGRKHRWTRPERTNSYKTEYGYAASPLPIKGLKNPSGPQPGEIRITKWSGGVVDIAWPDIEVEVMVDGTGYKMFELRENYIHPPECAQLAHFIIEQIVQQQDGSSDA